MLIRVDIEREVDGMKRRTLLKGSLITSASMQFGVASPASAASKGNPGIIEAAKSLANGQAITLKLLYPQGSINNIAPVAEAFTQETGVAIAFLETTVDDINTFMLNSAARKTDDFDIALPATFGIPDLVEAGSLEDITPFAEQYEPSNACPPSLYDLGDYYKGKKYGYQTDGDVYLMFYNSKFLNNSDYQSKYRNTFGQNLAVPASWEELDRQMAFFHNPDEGRFGGCMFRIPGYLVWEWWVRTHAAGGLPVKDDMSADVASEAGVTALESMIRASEFQHPSVRTNGLFENWAEYSNGQCYANIGWGGTQKYLNSEKSLLKGQMVYAPTPQVSYFNWGWNYVVSNFSSQKELSYLFCLFATLPEMSTIAVGGDGFFDPFRSSHYQDPGIANVYSKPFLVAHEAAMSTAIPDFYIQNRGEYIDVLRENILAAFNGDISAVNALRVTEIQWDDITEKTGRDSQIDQWSFLKEQYPL